MKESDQAEASPEPKVNSCVKSIGEIRVPYMACPGTGFLDGMLFGEVEPSAFVTLSLRSRPLCVGVSGRGYIAFGFGGWKPCCWKP